MQWSAVSCLLPLHTQDKTACRCSRQSTTCPHRSAGCWREGCKHTGKAQNVGTMCLLVLPMLNSGLQCSL
eukprot:scaffold319620_cov27-Tisochrysis_lutea.AAC.3